MKKVHFLGIIGMLCMPFLSQSCSNDDEVYVWYNAPNALVTVKGGTESCYLQLDDETALWPVNMPTSPFGGKEVRALVNFRDAEGDGNGMRAVYINWIDSILTKPVMPDLAEENDAVYGSDPVEVLNNWVTIVEDGYLTLRFSALWGNQGIAHRINLLSGGNPDNPYEVELRHDACGDTPVWKGDALVAFNLGSLPDTEGETVKLTLVWQTSKGKRTAEFDYCTREGMGNVVMPVERLDGSRLLK